MTAAERRIMLFAVALSGFTSFAYEVLWTRVLLFVVGNSTYAFVIILTAFLLGISVGGYAIGFVADSFRRPLRALGWIQLALGLAAVLALPTFPLLAAPATQNLLQGFAGRGWLSFVPAFVVSGVVLLPSALLIGVTFPLAARACTSDVRRTGAALGRVYAAITAGNIVGALLPALALIPLLGVQRSILAVASLNFAMGLLLLAPAGRARRWFVPAALSLLALLVARTPLPHQFQSAEQGPDDRVLFYREGSVATVKVWANRATGERAIAVDGTVIGGTGVSHLKQIVLAHLPKLLLREYGSELSIGLGSGILIGESGKHQRLRDIVCVEIEGAVVEGAKFFAAENHDVLNDPRVAVVIDDGVNYLLTTDRTFDIISSDAKSRPEYAGNSAFFSTEYHELVRGHLKPGGVAIQWVPTHIPFDDYRMVLRTFFEVFPHGSLWYFTGTDSILVGSDLELAIDDRAMAEAFAAAPLAFSALAAYGIDSPETLLAHYVADATAVRAEVASGPLNSLAHPYYEFYDPEDYAAPIQDRMLANLTLIESLRLLPAARPWLERLAGDRRARVVTAFDAETSFLEGIRRFAGAGDARGSAEAMRRAFQLAPWNRDVRQHIATHVLRLAEAETDPRRVQNLARRAVELWPDHAEARLLLARARLGEGDSGEALGHLRVALAHRPQFLAARRLAAAIQQGDGDHDAYLSELEAILRQDPDDPWTRARLASVATP